MPDAKADGTALKSYFEKVYPDLDLERVYASDMKKMVKWLAVLRENSVEIKLSEEEQEEDTTAEATEGTPEAVEVTEPEPAPAPAAKKRKPKAE